MTVTINGTTGIAGVDGSAATPAVQGADTNTGVFYGTDIVAVSTGGTERMRVNASGNVGIGTASPSGPLNVVAASVSALAIAINGRSADNLGAMYLYANDGTTQQATITASASEFRHSSVPAAAVQTFYTNAAERMRIDASGNLLFNSGYGSVATAYGVRAWVNFNGTGTVAIRGSGNVSSITDNGVGDYTVNFTTALVDANYGYAVTSGNGGNDVYSTAPYVTAPTVSAFRVVALLGARTALDCSHVSVSIFR